jgi:tRNA pseudouridine38-40 synthase
MNPMPNRWKCVCAYEGSGFCGWQSQARGTAVQDVIEARLAAILGHPVRTHASGRTDAGVHARGQVFHFDGDWRHGPEKLIAALRHRLPPSLQIRSVHRVSGAFHARFDAKGKVYVYDLFLGDADPFVRPLSWQVPRDLNLAAVRQAALRLRGRHDFRAFSAWNGAERDDTVRVLRRLDVVRRGRRVRLTFEADGFLYKMVRSIVGTLVAVGQGKIAPEEVGNLLKTRVRTPVVQTAPPQGLFLQRVIYR